LGRRVLDVDQILVGKNETRQKVNAWVRAERGFEGPYPNVGERIICHRNNHEEGLLNGTLWTVEEVGPLEDEEIPVVLKSDDGQRLATMISSLPFEGRASDVGYWGPNHFEFGYAITVHKSQGSQWDSVAIIDESGVFRSTAAKWLYTAVHPCGGPCP
jgi:exodeoxyribonuclease-5